MVLQLMISYELALRTLTQLLLLRSSFFFLYSLTNRNSFECRKGRDNRWINLCRLPKMFIFKAATVAFILLSITDSSALLQSESISNTLLYNNLKSSFHSSTSNHNHHASLWRSFVFWHSRQPTLHYHTSSWCGHTCICERFVERASGIHL